MGEAKRAGLIEAGWQELLDLGLRGPEAQAATLNGIVDECHELMSRGSQGDFAP